MHQKISYKQFCSFFIGVFSIFVIYHALVWSCMTSKFFDASPYYIGDLGRMSYQVDLLFPRIEEHTLPKKHWEAIPHQSDPIDVITIGDSFSNGMGLGKNPYYQDYLATRWNVNVLNIQNLDDSFSYIDTIYYLKNHGWLSNHHPKAILIESVEREVLHHIPSKQPVMTLTKKALDNRLVTKNFTTTFPTVTMVNTANYKAPYYTIGYHFSDHAQKEVYKLELNQNFFTSKDRNHLLVYHDDLEYSDQFTVAAVHNLNTQLNTLADILQKEGIKLIFMPCVDKYDLYYNHVKNKQKYPQNRFFSLLRQEPKRYLFVDTKALLTPLLKNRVQDLYYADDTHWSYKASQVISNSSPFTFLKEIDTYETLPSR
ncbi:MAG: hypothetical protein WA080_09320 [Sulfuricurvum sp.]